MKSLKKFLPLIVVCVLGVAIGYFIVNSNDSENDVDVVDTEISTEKADTRLSVERIVTDSELVKDKYTTTTFPQALADLKFFNASNFTEADLTEYKAGNEYYLTFVHPNTDDFDSIGSFYVDESLKNGFNLVDNLFGANGTKVVYETNFYAVKALSYVKKSNDDSFEVRERIKVFKLNQ